MADFRFKCCLLVVFSTHVCNMLKLLFLFSTVKDYKPTVQQMGDRGSVAEINNDNIFPISEPRVITSMGYPYHYFPDQLYMWNITLTDSAYITLLFSNISLHVYKVNIICIVVVVVPLKFI